MIEGVRLDISVANCDVQSPSGQSRYLGDTSDQKTWCRIKKYCVAYLRRSRMRKSAIDNPGSLVLCR
jgi:hypothetical protein